MPSRSSAAEDPFALFLADTAERLLRGATAAGVRRVLIDGRSGAGKSTLGRMVATRWPGGERAQLVALDELYPGWGGLREGSALATELVLRPHADCRWGSYRRFDWDRGTFDGPSVDVDPDRPLVVEGCGALTAASAPLADLTAWVDGPADARRDRALARDGDGFVPYWDIWAAQEDAHIHAERPHERAALTFYAR